MNFRYKYDFFREEMLGLGIFYKQLVEMFFFEGMAAVESDTRWGNGELVENGK